MLMGLLQPDAGRASILGKDCWREAPVLRDRVGYVPERPRYYDWMTVAETGWFTAGFHSREFLPRFQEWAAKFQLDPKARLRNLSKGQRARVLVPCARAQRGKIRARIKGQLVDMMATTDEAQIAAGREVLIVDIHDDVAHVVTAPEAL